MSKLLIADTGKGWCHLYDLAVDAWRKYADQIRERKSVRQIKSNGFMMDDGRIVVELEDEVTSEMLSVKTGSAI